MVLEAVRKHGAIRVVTEEQHAAALQANAGLVVGRLQEFRQPGLPHGLAGNRGLHRDARHLEGCLGRRLETRLRRPLYG